MNSKALARIGALGVALLIPAGAHAQGVAIEHNEIGCIVAGQFPKMNACFSPASLVGKARVYFRPETLSTWYYVEMASDAPCFSGLLLRPSKALIGKKIFYYLDVQGGGTGRTPEYAPIVVRSAQECTTKLPVAPVSATGPAAVFPAIPAGFVGGGVSTGVITGGVAAAAVIGGGAVLLTNDDDTTAPITTVPVTNPPATTPPVTVPPPTAPPPSSGLVVACQASPRSGEAPLRVSFATFPSGGTGTYEFEWSFGDGGESSNPNPSHTFVSPGVFNSTVRVRSGAQTATCSRPITVTTTPTPPPPPPNTFTLSVSLAGDGTGTVTGPGINCPGDCVETFTAGTPVTLNATPGSGSTFIGWSGACTGTGPCMVSMTSNQAVTAKFDAFPILTVTKSGTGTGDVTGSGISCGADCTESYAPGTVVTLTASPTGGSTFVGWTGACTGTGTCTVTMDASKSVNAQFDAPKTATLTVTKSGTGTGDVSGTGIACGADCSETYPAGTVVTLTASPTGGSTFVGWTGACTGTGPCTVTMDVSKTVNAQFDPVRLFTLTLTATDNARDCGGPPSLAIDPPKAVCTAAPDPGTTCSQTYAVGTVVQITSSTNCGSSVCWSGACAGSPSTLGSVCTLTMNTDQVAGATFVFGPCGIAAQRPSVSLSWSTQLDAAGGVGHAVVDGQLIVAASGRRVETVTPKRDGESVVTGTLVGAGKPGTWRFEAASGEALEPGSLRVLRGEVVLLTPTAVVFRVKGIVGEQVAFSYRLRR